jgi:hypothetical protein
MEGIEYYIGILHYGGESHPAEFGFIDCYWVALVSIKRENNYYEYIRLDTMAGFSIKGGLRTIDED